MTGATGFIGKWMAKELLNSGYRVCLVVRDKNKLSAEMREQCCIVEKAVEELTEHDFEDSYDYFFHLAWGGVAPELKNDHKRQMGNINGAINAIRVAKGLDCKKFISLGTVAEYAKADREIDGKMKESPTDIYGAAKTATYYFLDVLSKQLEMPLVWIIMSSVYGEGREDNNILTYTIRTLLKGEKPVFGNLDKRWDFLYVGDAVRAIRLVAERNNTCSVYGVGSGSYKSLKEYVEIIRDAIDPALPLGISEDDTQSKKSVSSYVDITDLQKDTGFEVKYSFEEGISRMIEYFKNNSKD